MTPITLEPIALLVGLGAASVATVLWLLRRLRQRVSTLGRDLRAARARATVSDVLLGEGGSERLSAALPAVGMMADAVTALFPVSSLAARTRLLVASPPDSTDPSLRAAAALLAAVSVSAAEVPEFGRALRGRRPERGTDISSVLRRGTTSLPFSTRERLAKLLEPMSFVVVPVSRPGGGPVLGLLLAVGRGSELDRLAADLGRAAGRMALLFPAPRRGPQRAPVPQIRRRQNRPPTPRDAELILWLDTLGEVAACEPLQDDWLVDPPPRSLGELFGLSSADLLQRAVPESPATIGLARLADQTMAEVSLLRLADGERNTWGYAAFLRRVGGRSEESREAGC
jgi:hypothetical protein